MSEEIKVGDWVILTRYPHHRDLGHLFLVAEIDGFGRIRPNGYIDFFLGREDVTKVGVTPKSDTRKPILSYLDSGINY